MFRVEFERRLKRLYKEILYYYSTGRVGSLFPCLFSVYTYLWSHDPYNKNYHSPRKS